MNSLFLFNPVFMYLFITWYIFWKGLALWKSARRGEKWWFIILLVLNTFGLLEILYLFVFSKYERTTKLLKKEEEQHKVDRLTAEESETKEKI
ncbi:MAG: DUF5652 family protein [Minisyncoccia bacterium]